MKTYKFVVCCFSLFAFWGLIAACAQESSNTVSPRDQFSQLMTQWQNGSPVTVLEKAESQYMLQRDDNIGSLERNIVTLAATLNPKPEIPEEARRHIIKAETLMKDAKQPSDYDEVIAEYGQVRLLAPWWPALWYNRAVVREAQGQYTNAIFCLNNYLLTKPSEADARTAQDKIYALEAEQEKAAKDKVREDAKARVEQITAVARQRLNSFEGMWHITHYEEGGQPSSTWGSKATDNVRIGKAGDDFDISGPTDQLGGSGYHLSGRTLRQDMVSNVQGNRRPSGRFRYTRFHLGASAS